MPSVLYPRIHLLPRGSEFLIVSIAVDDLAFGSNSHNMLNELKTNLSATFDVGEAFRRIRNSLTRRHVKNATYPRFQGCGFVPNDTVSLLYRRSLIGYYRETDSSMDSFVFVYSTSEKQLLFLLISHTWLKDVQNLSNTPHPCCGNAHGTCQMPWTCGMKTRIHEQEKFLFSWTLLCQALWWAPFLNWVEHLPHSSWWKVDQRG